MIDPNNLDALISALFRHPDVLGCVLWTTEDVKNECERLDIDFDNLNMSMFRFKYWEEAAVEDGWHVITDVLNDYIGEDD